MLLALLFMVGVVLPTIGSADSSRRPLDQVGIWYDVNESTIRDEGSRTVIPTDYRVLAADLSALDSFLAQAPLENTLLARTANMILPLPLPDGQVGHFRIAESPVMAPELAAKELRINKISGGGQACPFPICDW